ncbi:MAG: hypothetical protein CBE14_003475, partial [Rickettsiales bacterium TMED254]
MDNQKNLILAVTASILVLLIFDYFYGSNTVNQQAPLIENESSKIYSEKDEPQIDKKNSKETRKIGNKEDRIIFDMKRVQGTINLFGATLDELTLKDYRESINQDSANIKLLQKEDSKNPYFIRMGWASNNESKLPDKNTLWKSEKKKY